MVQRKRMGWFKNSKNALEQRACEHSRAQVAGFDLHVDALVAPTAHSGHFAKQ